MQGKDGEDGDQGNPGEPGLEVYLGQFFRKQTLQQKKIKTHVTNCNNGVKICHKLLQLPVSTCKQDNLR